LSDPTIPGKRRRYRRWRCGSMDCADGLRKGQKRRRLKSGLALPSIGRTSAGDFSYWVDRKREAYCLAVYGADRNPGLDNTGIIMLYFSYGEELPSETDPTLPRICRDRVTSPPGK
jgi:hypothetical protein